MNPIPHGAPSAPLFPDGYLDLPFLVIVVSFIVLFGVGLLSLRSGTRKRA